VPAYALPHAEAYADREFSPVNIIINGEFAELYGNPFIADDVSFAPARELGRELGIFTHWERGTGRISLYQNGNVLRFNASTNEATYNGNPVDSPALHVIDGRAYIPIKLLSETFGYNLHWSDNYRAVAIMDCETVLTASNFRNILPFVENYTEEDLFWLSRIVHAEARGECYYSKLAVANVILNRRNSYLYPDTIKEVVFDRNHGVQFTPTANGAIHLMPCYDSIKAAREALNGNNNAGDAMFFLNPRIATSNWIVRNRTFAFALGNHDFYA